MNVNQLRAMVGAHSAAMDLEEEQDSLAVDEASEYLEDLIISQCEILTCKEVKQTGVDLEDQCEQVFFVPLAPGIDTENGTEYDLDICFQPKVANLEDRYSYVILVLVDYQVQDFEQSRCLVLGDFHRARLSSNVSSAFSLDVFRPDYVDGETLCYLVAYERGDRSYLNDLDDLVELVDGFDPVELADYLHDAGDRDTVSVFGFSMNMDQAIDAFFRSR